MQKKQSRPVRTWGRAGNMRRVRYCRICKDRMYWGDRYTWDASDPRLPVWHIACEQKQQESQP